MQEPFSERPSQAPINFWTLSKIVADTPAQIRRSDVYRFLDAAHNCGALEVGAEWLLRQRPDLAEEIDGCLVELHDP